MRPAVLFDRDGVVNDQVDHGEAREKEGKDRLTSPWSLAEFMSGLNPDVRYVVEHVHRMGYLAIIVTNQPSVAYGDITMEEVEKIEAVLRELGFDDIYACRHTKESSCECRKPKPGLIFAAAQKWDILLSASYFIGDSDTDIVAAKAAGCRPILLRTPHNAHVQACIEIEHLRDLISYIGA